MKNILAKLQYPLVQSPMAGVQGSDLAIAVCQAGGLGSLPCAMLSSDIMRQELEKISRATKAPYNVNFFAHETPDFDLARDQKWRKVLTPYYEEFGLDIEAIPTSGGRAPFNDEMASVLEIFKPAVVSFHFGLPEASLLNRVKKMGSKILASATTVAEAVWLVENGVDGVIAQGWEAGGHRGHFLSDDLTEQMGIFALLPQIVDAVDVPVMAAGGVGSPTAVKALLDLGASAVQVGTSFLLCDEVNTTPVHRTALKSKAAQHTAVTNVFSGRPARGIMNRMIKELGPISEDVSAFPLPSILTGPLKQAVEKTEPGDFTSLWSGQNNKGCQEIPAAEMVRWLMSKL